jgi:hypothetical protein
MIQPITFIREDYCFKCDTPRMIECFDVFNRPLNYSLLLDRKEQMNIQDRINMKDLYYMKCKRCGTIFIIDWVLGNIPKPLSMMSNIHIFLNNFINENKK